jgi:hypothetical protein
MFTFGAKFGSDSLHKNDGQDSRPRRRSARAEFSMGRIAGGVEVQAVIDRGMTSG